MKYDKEFILLCSEWLRGSIQDKELFSKYASIMKKNSFTTTGYRIWEFDGEDLKDVIFREGDIEIDKNPIESCFSLDDNVYELFCEKQNIDIKRIEEINNKLSMWVSNVKIITRWSNSIYFDVYEPIKEAINDFWDGNNLNEFTSDEISLLEQRLQFYKHQSEILHLGKYNNISSGEILYVMIEKSRIEYFLDDTLRSILHGETSDYFVFYNDDEFRELFQKHKSFKDIFYSISDLLSEVSFSDDYKKHRKNKKTYKSIDL